jgi:hypothetical protein
MYGAFARIRLKPGVAEAIVQLTRIVFSHS